jgi:hypothetical protein
MMIPMPDRAKPKPDVEPHRTIGQSISISSGLEEVQQLAYNQIN